MCETKPQATRKSPEVDATFYVPSADSYLAEASYGKHGIVSNLQHELRNMTLGSATSDTLPE